jgi:hypothetical protein
MNKFDDAIYALEKRKEYWQEKLRVAKHKEEFGAISCFQENIDNIDLAIKRLKIRSGN